MMLNIGSEVKEYAWENDLLAEDRKPVKKYNQMIKKPWAMPGDFGTQIC